VIGSAQTRPTVLTDTQQMAHDSGSMLARKIWLPKAVYDLLPVFYIVSGIAALLATLYISEWFWVLPHYLLFAAACLHLGGMIFRRRRRRQPDA